MSESDPKLAPELFDLNSASEAAIEIAKIPQVDKLSGNQMQFLNNPYLKQLNNGGLFFNKLTCPCMSFKKNNKSNFTSNLPYIHFVINTTRISNLA